MKDIKIKEASFFPEPQKMWKELPTDRLGKEATEYMKAWIFDGLMVIASCGEYEDGKEWLHISFSRKSRIPSYDDMQRVKRDFIGEDKKAVFVLPEKENYVNIHKNCLHLFYSKENPLPEFSNGTGSI